MSIEKERRKYVSLGNLLTILAMAGAIAGTYAQSAGEQAKQKERVDNLTKQIDEVKKDGKDTNQKVEQILRTLEAMQAVDFDRRRREATRRDR
ncbi:MAG: hypothetical protein U0990_12505 [Candidatus Nanopelagicales bacterium]|nr:hypothetical protein [Candidatus Nanopelagicales bacterium]